MTTAGPEPNPQARMRFADLISSVPSFAFSAIYFYFAALGCSELFSYRCIPLQM
ncbi:MAG: hypothetical protein HW389_3743, partial [Bacteroidetes bacterium]|nr:hypothetical protein [Bacteroidota bacterium]